MVKKIVISLVFISMVVSGLSAQEDSSADRALNNISVGFGIITIGGSYERMFGRHFSLLADLSYTNIGIIEETTASLKGRVYPFGKAFFLDLGLGYTYGRGLINAMKDMILGILTFGWWFTQIDLEDANNHCFLVQPGIGWKIDIGKQDAFVLPINMGLDLRLGAEVPDVVPYFRIGVGYSF